MWPVYMTQSGPVSDEEQIYVHYNLSSRRCF